MRRSVWGGLKNNLYTDQRESGCQTLLKQHGLASRYVADNHGKAAWQFGVAAIAAITLPRDFRLISGWLPHSVYLFLISDHQSRAVLCLL
jgi:hypothetical protein